LRTARPRCTNGPSRGGGPVATALVALTRLGIRTITFASALAALACTRIGGRTGIPSLPEVLAFLADHGCD